MARSKATSRTPRSRSCSEQRSWRSRSRSRRRRVETLAEAERVRRHIEAETDAEATRLRGGAEADVIRERGAAEAEAKRQMALAEAEGLHAEAEGMRERAEAWQQYSDAALGQLLIERLPEIASAVAAPLDRVVLIGGGDSESAGVERVTGSVTRILAQLPAVVEAVSGIDLTKLLAGVTPATPPPALEEDVELVAE